MEKLGKELEFYKKNKLLLLKKYRGKYVVIVGDDYFGGYDNQVEAVQAALRKKHQMGTFLVKKVVEVDEPAIFSRVAT
ncbi:MAG: hypothetical protein OYH77_05435 [Pseudomonadota bacterium]|nr:hypothetical protein [Pseudomonadota bacterium]